MSHGSLLRNLFVLSLALTTIAVVMTESNAWGQSSVRVKKKKTPKPAEAQDIIVPVPQSVLNFASAPQPEAPKQSPHWELAASSWAPRSLSENAYLSDASNFQRLKMPMVTLNQWQGDGYAIGAIKWTPKYGVSFNQLTRRATMQLATVEIPVTQTMNVFSVRLGVEITPEKDWLGWVRPFLNVSALPSFAVTGSSEISDGGSRGLFALEEVAGVSLQVPPLASLIGINNLGFEVGLQATQGAGESSLSGVGVLAGTRIDL